MNNKSNSVDFQVKSQTIKLLADYEKRDLDMKVGTNQVALNIDLAISNGLIGLPNLTNAKNKEVNDFAEKFVTQVLEMVWKDLPATQKACLRNAIPIAVSGNKFKYFAENNKKRISDIGNIWVNTAQAQLPENLNKDGAEKVALPMKDILKFSKVKLKMIESPSKSTAIETACNKLIVELDKLDYLESGNVDVSARDKRALKLAYTKLKSKLEEINNNIDTNIRKAS